MEEGNEEENDRKGWLMCEVDTGMFDSGYRQNLLNLYSLATPNGQNSQQQLLLISHIHHSPSLSLSPIKLAKEQS